MKKILFFAACTAILMVSSCSKPGKGGKAILSVHVFEGVCDGSNRTVVPEAVVHIKYAATAVDHDLTTYDDAQITDFGGKTVFEELRRGDYYLYAVSKDGTKTGGTYFDIQNKIGEREVVICTGAF